MWLDLMAWDREPRAGTTEPARCLPTPATLLFFQWSCFCFVNIRVYFLIVIIKACESMKSRRIVDINGKGQPMTLLEDNKQYLCDLGIKKNGWDKTQETWSIKGKIIRWLKKLMKFCSPNKQHAAGVSSMPIILCSTYLAIVQRGFAGPRVHRWVKGDNTFKIRVYYSLSGKKQ